MENIQVNVSIYDEIIREAERNFEIALKYYEFDHGYESDDMNEMDNNINSLKVFLNYLYLILF